MKKQVEISKFDTMKMFQEYSLNKIFPKSNFCKPVLRHNRHIYFDTEKYFIINLKKLFLSSVLEKCLIYNKNKNITIF